MADEVKSEFAQQVVEPPQKSEFELVQERINNYTCLLYTSPSPRDQRGSRMPSSA